MAAIVRGDRDAERAAESRLADLIANSQALADAYGRRRIMLETAAIRKREPAPTLQLDLRSSAGPIDPGDTFGGALDAVLARDPVLARTRSEIRAAYSKEHGFALIRSSKIEITKAVQKAVTKAIVAGESVDDAAKMIEKLGPFSRAYAETVYRTNVTTAYTAGRFRQARDPVVADVVKAMRYEAINDSVTRPAHAKLDGLIAAVDDPIWQKIAPPNGYNSFAPWTRISGLISAGSKAAYSGPIIEIETWAGCRLAVTPNHPILSAAGYVPAASLHEGEYLLVDLGFLHRLALGSWDDAVSAPLVLGGAIDDQQIPPSIEDAYEAISAKRAGPRFVLPRASALDFHGDSRFYQGDVNVVSCDGLLPYNVETTGPSSPSQHGDEFALMLAAESPSPVHHAVGVPFSGALVRLSTSANLYASELQPVINNGPRTAMLYGELQRRNPGRVIRDKITRVHVRSWLGHVYDLQSPNGWIVAGGVVASNCRCTVELVSGADLKRKRLIGSRGAVRAAKIPSDWNADPGFKNVGRPDLLMYG